MQNIYKIKANIGSFILLTAVVLVVNGAVLARFKDVRENEALLTRSGADQYALILQISTDAKRLVIEKGPHTASQLRRALHDNALQMGGVHEQMLATGNELAALDKQVSLFIYHANRFADEEQVSDSSGDFRYLTGRNVEDIKGAILGAQKDSVKLGYRYSVLAFIVMMLSAALLGWTWNGLALARRSKGAMVTA